MTTADLTPRAARAVARGGAASALRDTAQLTLRHLRTLARQPWYVAITIVQPMIWLVLFGALFRRVVELPGFAADSYLDFLAPGIVVMSALFSGGWSGMGVILDLQGGVLDRFLVTPVHRGALLTGRVLMQAVTILLQSLVILGAALLLGARFAGGARGVAVLLLACVLLGAAFAALSNALALVLRREESVIATVNFVVLPASFVSSAFMASALAPGWVRSASRWNPVDWAIVASREALGGAPDWAAVGWRLAGLLALALACAALSTRALRAGGQRAEAVRRSKSQTAATSSRWVASAPTDTRTIQWPASVEGVTNATPVALTASASASVWASSRSPSSTSPCGPTRPSGSWRRHTVCSDTGARRRHPGSVATCSASHRAFARSRRSRARIASTPSRRRWNHSLSARKRRPSGTPQSRYCVTAPSAAERR
jgi:ABC-2 type transport system permease protein